MDWATFFKDYGQSLFTLGGVFLGSAIAFLINYLNLRNQSRERDKDRQEQRRESKIQSREKWIERDILTITDSVEKTLRVLSEHEDSVIRIQTLIFGHGVGIVTIEELQAELKSYYDKLTRLVLEATSSKAWIERLVYSFEESEIIAGYKDYITALDKLMHKMSEFLKTANTEEPIGKPIKGLNTENEWHTLNVEAGKFHQTLRNKLISIRDN